MYSNFGTGVRIRSNGSKRWTDFRVQVCKRAHVLILLSDLLFMLLVVVWLVFRCLFHCGGKVATTMNARIVIKFASKCPWSGTAGSRRGQDVVVSRRWQTWCCNYWAKVRVRMTDGCSRYSINFGSKFCARGSVFVWLPVMYMPLCAFAAILYSLCHCATSSTRLHMALDWHSCTSIVFVHFAMHYILCSFCARIGLRLWPSSLAYFPHAFTRSLHRYLWRFTIQAGNSLAWCIIHTVFVVMLHPWVGRGLAVCLSKRFRTTTSYSWLIYAPLNIRSNLRITRLPHARICSTLTASQRLSISWVF